MNLETLNSKIDQLKVGERLVLEGIHDHVYHASHGIGSTLMKAACNSMASYDAALKAERTSTADMLIGTATHTLVLEPSLFEDRVIQLPDGVVRGVSKKYKDFAELHPNKIHLKECELEKVSNMHAAILQQAMDFFDGGQPELSYWYKHETGLIMKARVDYQKGDAAIDLKTTRHENARLFAHSVKYDYAIQDSHYRIVTGLADMVFLGVCKEAPHQCFIAKQGAEVRQVNDKKVHQALKNIAFSKEVECFDFAPLTLTETELTKFEREQLL